MELGVVTVRFEIMKRKVLFLQYILQQDKQSMIYQVFDATVKHPIKNDFVKMCESYLQVLNINLSFEEIENLSKWKFKKIVKEKTTLAAFEYLIQQKDKPRKNGKVSKISIIKYEKLELQQYLQHGNTKFQNSYLKHDHKHWI